MKYCRNCQQLVRPSNNFSWIVLFILCCLIIPGIIYAICWANREDKCPICKGSNWGIKPVIETVQQQVEKGVFCPNCGTKINEGYDYCSGCGRKI